MPRRKIDQIFKAFADITRLRILHILTLQKEFCVCKIIEILKMRQPKISRHLAYLRKLGLVKVRKDGLWSHYSLTASQGKFHEQLIKCLRQCFSESDILKKDRATLRKIRAKKTNMVLSKVL